MNFHKKDLLRFYYYILVIVCVAVLIALSGCNLNIAKADHVDDLTKIVSQNAKHINEIKPTIPHAITSDNARELAEQSSAVSVPIEGLLSMVGGSAGLTAILTGLLGVGGVGMQRRKTKKMGQLAQNLTTMDQKDSAKAYAASRIT